MLSEGTRLLPYEQYQEQARQLFDKVVSRCPSFAEVRVLAQSTWQRLVSADLFGWFLISTRRVAQIATRPSAGCKAFCLSRCLQGYNKRATLNYMQRRFAESIKDCQMTLELQPYHFGAASGMGLCHLEVSRTCLAAAFSVPGVHHAAQNGDASTLIVRHPLHQHLQCSRWETKRQR